ncbi:tRNA (adenosine(37)-N6)-threonylcarbamoyltransferase complex dimerization subunit type 1 TsaB [Lactobacillus sp. ESL0791]|uniref:tRNA (adenosine(37)-N6)-threonylcarbamoyltransferase complex dimerization subunit type 1 TsaB n=1 Tax=Lactobacillus sp. ESL0791 TaxID=2983234 RepID=UPI0023F8FDB2|nr:tRNA (adenosine(37)-N6)-threonylcarbamoyltransferase complex dimerization subunit type 1 TsaB [Lactobacillus sp. ESL0791]MDF7638399.1 tRNA (adenosine(37)-N6)-threonylcarbamoyltransferase complex dimerization subunit type 1 TsaB [Lactobacillus sp. ESL0791]
MKILSVSTATDNLSIALNENEKVIVEKNEQGGRNYNEHLDPIINEMLTANKLQLADIDRYAVAIGPGSYTGLRIGITTVKMFASILEKEVAGISTLQALAVNQIGTKMLTVAGIDARNDNYFAGAYCNEDGQLVNVIPDGHYHITTLLQAVKEWAIKTNCDKVIFLGSGFAKQDELIKQLGLAYAYGSDEQNLVHAGRIGKLALGAPLTEPDDLLPKYLRRTQAEIDWHNKTGQPFVSDRNYVEEV